jgi:hypothetical protein
MQSLIIVFCTPLVMEPTVCLRVLWEPTVPARNTFNPRRISQLSLKAYFIWD